MQLLVDFLVGGFAVGWFSWFAVIVGGFKFGGIVVC